MSNDSDELREALRRAVSPRYEVGKLIGRGGMAFVYQGRDATDRRAIAFKVLRRDYAATLGPGRFLREIRLLSHLHHPGILPLLDSGHTDSLFYFMMPLVEGETLEARLNREPQLPLDVVRQIVAQAAAALDYAHDAGVIHRDIKPSNLFLAASQVLVADFGIAKDLAPSEGDFTTSVDKVVGTMLYMSPEQADGQSQPDRRADVYSLGCVTYQMLAGETPFTGANTQAVLARHRSMPAPSARLLRPELPPGVDAVIRKALAKSPADRYQRAGDFATALSDPDQMAAALREAQDREAPVVTAVPAGRRRLRWTWAVLGLGAVVATAVLIRRPPPLDPGVVLGFPLVDFGADSAFGNVGKQLPFVIGHALEHTEPLRWRDGWTYLDDRQRADPSSVTVEAMRGIARAQRARYYFDGVITRTPDSATITLRLHDAGDGAQLAQASAGSGPGIGAISQASLRAVTELLPRLLAPGRSVDPAALRALTDRRPGAIANWIQGEELYRKSQFVAAITYFRRAVDADSALALAALRGAEAADWLDGPTEAREFLTLAEAHLSLLPPKYATFATGLGHYFAGRADSALVHLRRALAADSGFTAAWMTVGEVFFHLLPQEAGAPDSAARAAFLAARRTDPGFAPPLYHLATLALRQAAAGAADSLMRDFRAFHPDSAWTVHTGLMLDCARRGPDAIDWPRSAREHPLEVVEAAGFLVSLPGYAECARRGFRAVLALTDPTPSILWGATLGLQSLLVAEGDDSGLTAVLESAIGRGLAIAHGLIVLDAAAGAGLHDRAVETVRLVGEDYGQMQGLTLRVLGGWQAAMGDTGRLSRIASAAASLAAHTEDPGDRTIAAALSARLALARADSAGAAAAFARLRPAARRNDLQWGLYEPLGEERLLQAELLLAAGRPLDAIETANDLDHPIPISFLLYRGPSLALRMRAARAIGRSDLARQFEARLRTLGREDLVPGSHIAHSPSPGGT